MGQIIIKVCDLCNAKGQSLVLGKFYLANPGFSGLEKQVCKSCNDELLKTAQKLFKKRTDLNDTPTWTSNELETILKGNEE